jgi:cell division protein ZapE
MLMDLFFAAVPVAKKRRVHFNAFMVDIHARIHTARQAGAADPIALVAKQVAADTALLCFDEFQVGDVADAMILGRLFEQLFAGGVVIVATSNTPPQNLYEGGLNRQLFLPFIALIEDRLAVVAINSTVDYRLNRKADIAAYITPLGPDAKQAMDEGWKTLTGGAAARARDLAVLGRIVTEPLAAVGVARVSFDDLCVRPLAAADYLAIAHEFHTVLIDNIPVMGAERRNEARRFIVLIDTLYDEGVKLICSAAAEPQALYRTGDGARAFRRTASRLAEMQSADYLARAGQEAADAG